MTYAGRFLLGANRKLTDIILDCGVENLSHFHRIFRAHHGASPHQWRKRRQVQMVQPTLQDGVGHEINLTKE
jgi:AraC family cel operon transcriptional repressor